MVTGGSPEQKVGSGLILGLTTAAMLLMASTSLDNSAQAWVFSGPKLAKTDRIFRIVRTDEGGRGGPYAVLT